MKRENVIDKEVARAFCNSIENSRDRILAIKKDRINSLATLVYGLAGHTEDALTFNDETGFPSVGNYEYEDNSLLVYGIRARWCKEQLNFLIEVNTVTDEDAPDGLDKDGWFEPNMTEESWDNYMDPVKTALCLSAFIE